jgi:hypothetical protein
LNIEIANQSSRRAYLIKNKVPSSERDEAKFLMYHKASKNEKVQKNSQGIMTYQDIQLYDYLYNPPENHYLK